MFNSVHNCKTTPYFSYDEGKHFVHSGKNRMYTACLSHFHMISDAMLLRYILYTAMVHIY